jgi:hypothetical protein
VASWPAKQQESRHTTFGELKQNSGLGGGNVKFIFNLRVTAGKLFWALSENILRVTANFFLKVNILGKFLRKKIGKILRVTAALKPVSLTS